MDILEFRDYCLSFKGTSEDTPFDEKTLVFKVMGKMFALVDIDNFSFTNLKAKPEKVIRLKQEYEGIIEGFHMNKKYWISVKLDGSISDAMIKKLIKNSYNEVVAKLTKKQKEELKKIDN